MAGSNTCLTLGTWLYPTQPTLNVVIGGVHAKLTHSRVDDCLVWLVCVLPGRITSAPCASVWRQSVSAVGCRCHDLIPLTHARPLSRHVCLWLSPLHGAPVRCSQALHVQFAVAAPFHCSVVRGRGAAGVATHEGAVLPCVSRRGRSCTCICV
jgi:hypothetical protein